jgi:FKBP-type peptidyl-prolyl cis-trans isomerase FklB
MVIALVISLAVVSCQQNKYRGYKKSNSGLLYKFYHRSGDTTKPHINDMITIKMKYGTEDTTIFSSDKSPRPLMMPQKKSDYKGDIYEAFSMMSVGDSASFILRPDSFFLKTARNPRIPPYIDSNDVMIFHVKLLSSLTREAYQRAEQARKDSLKSQENQFREQYIKNNGIGVAPLASGLYFIEATPGNGTIPQTGQWIKLHFSVTALDGKIIYSSFNDKPAEFEFGKQFENKGVTEAVGLMSKGSKARLIVPSDLAFGEKGRGELIPPFSTLLYDVQIVDIMTKQQHDIEQEKIKQEKLKKYEQNKIESRRFLEQNSKQPGVVTLTDGLQYKILNPGSGTKPSLTDQVKVNYRGTIINGTVFDSSYDRKEPSVFKVNSVISGWSEALQMMPLGAKWILYIPPELAYKDNGRGKIIEPNMALIFEVELLEILK